MKTKNTKNSQVAFRIDSGLYKEVRKVCEQRNISITDFMTNAIKERLNTNLIDLIKETEKGKSTE